MSSSKSETRVAASAASGSSTETGSAGANGSAAPRETAAGGGGSEPPAGTSAAGKHQVSGMKLWASLAVGMMGLCFAPEILL